MDQEPKEQRDEAMALPQQRALGFLDLLIVLAKHKGKIALIVVASAVLSAGISLLLPNIYTATAKLLPPEQRQSNSAAFFLGQFSALAGINGSSLGIKNPSDLYVGMLGSRTVADNIISRFALQEVYGTDTIVETRKALANHVSIAAGKDGLITVEFDDEDPGRAASVANAYVEELDKLTQSLAVTEAAQRRLFFERQLKQAKSDLADAEIAFKTTQERTGLIKLDDQGRAVIEAVATLRAQIAAKEVELRAMKTFATEQNSDYVRGQQQLAGLRAELLKLERSTPSASGDVLLPTGKVPEVGLEYIRRYRDVKYHETMFEVIAKQFEVAKIDEAKESAVIQVVDQAVPPDRKSKPRRALIVLLSTVSAGLLAVFWAFLLELNEAARRDPNTARRMRLLQQYLRRRPANESS